MQHMLPLLNCFTPYHMHCKFGLFFKDGTLHALLNSMKHSLRSLRIDLLPDQKSLSSVRSALAIRIGDAMLDKGQEAGRKTEYEIAGEVRHDRE